MKIIVETVENVGFEEVSITHEKLPFEQLALFDKVSPYVMVYSGRIGYLIIDCFHHYCFFAKTLDCVKHLCGALGVNGQQGRNHSFGATHSAKEMQPESKN